MPSAAPLTTPQNLRVAVTGGTSGLGLALVRCLAADGAQVAFVARTPEAVAQIAQALARHMAVVGPAENLLHLFDRGIMTIP